MTTQNNGAKRRNSDQIKAEILERAKNRSLKTHILYDCNLSYAQRNKYFKLLLDANLLGQEGRFYRTTQRGRNWIDLNEKKRNLENKVHLGSVAPYMSKSA